MDQSYFSDLTVSIPKAKECRRKHDMFMLMPRIIGFGNTSIAILLTASCRLNSCPGSDIFRGCEKKLSRLFSFMHGTLDTRNFRDLHVIVVRAVTSYLHHSVEAAGYHWDTLDRLFYK